MRNKLLKAIRLIEIIVYLVIVFSTFNHLYSFSYGIPLESDLLEIIIVPTILRFISFYLFGQNVIAFIIGQLILVLMFWLVFSSLIGLLDKTKEQ